jgi:tetratricopeptide (TPR) repeat protein
MHRYIVALLLVFLIQTRGIASPAPAVAPQDEVKDALSHASALYYEARFKEAIDLLLRVDEVLKPQANRVQDKINVQLQLAISYVGLNDMVQGKARFSELYALKPDYVLDAQQFSPKVLALADQAKAEQNELRARALCDDTLRQLNSPNAVALADQIGSLKQKCPGIDGAVSKAADALYRKGLDSYKRNDLPDALTQFRSALKLDPSHDLAAQYRELAEGKLRIAGDQTMTAWKKNFDARDFPAAAESYRQMKALNVEGTAAMLDQARTAYRGVLAPLVESWGRACSSRDPMTMDSIRKQATALLPDPAIGQDLLAQMSNCGTAACVQMEPTLALVRLKNRVNPDIPSSVRDMVKRGPMTVRVKVRIDEKGAVAVNQTIGDNSILNESVKSAVSRWKFLPAIVKDEARCVDTEIPIVISSDSAPTR